MGGPGSGAGRDPGRRRQILELRAARLSTAEIARRLGMTPQLVHHHLKKAGAVTPRQGLVRCRACGGRVAAGRHGILHNRPTLCLPCLAECPAAPFADRLRSHRLGAGLTQAELARRSGVAERKIAGYERGEARPAATNLARLAGVLGPGLG
jgi:DNA-binding transcriptional regulator YiaG